MSKIERKFLAHYIDSAFNGESTAYIRLGKDLEDYTIALNAETETKNNILGENSTQVKGYQPQGTVEPYYAYEGDLLYEKLEAIINNRSTGTELETTVVDVLVDSAGEVKWAYRENAVIVPQSIGGDTSGVQIPFEVYYNGGRVEGTFDVKTKTFTEATTATE